MKIVETNLWQSLNPVSQTKVFWKPFRLLGSITSKWVPLLDLKQIAYFTKFERLYIYSSDQKKWLFLLHFGSSMLIFRSPASLRKLKSYFVVVAFMRIKHTIFLRNSFRKIFKEFVHYKTLASSSSFSFSFSFSHFHKLQSLVISQFFSFPEFSSWWLSKIMIAAHVLEKY